MVVDALDTLQSDFAGCETLAFADLSTQMILVTNSATTLPRETLDALCTEAALTLGTKGKIAIGSDKSTTAIVAGQDQLRVFLRAESEPSDVLCCVCQPDVNIAGFLPAARACLEQISGGA
ncbi:hypothetical protein SLH49_00925 [Cognatiyoonia sp. IB215446]|uniref:hypothetical protein n=1 Tax=Cognatiyoonia sp. IB215446 TaxID=3097355 RepID=UPI002A0F6CF4|nr:hypothetical protein [Cognatiyoonia sp. IB215446]MDX8346532.1 hypothetical protein [Cognatiyoonia sp. IB215446]